LAITFDELEIPEIRKFRPLTVGDNVKTLEELDLETKLELLLPSNDKLKNILPEEYISPFLYPIRTPRCLEKIYHLEMLLLNQDQDTEKDIVNNIFTLIQHCSKYFFKTVKGHSKEVTDERREEKERSLELNCFKTDLDPLVDEGSIKYAIGTGSGSEEDSYLKIAVSASTCDVPVFLNERDYATALSYQLRHKLSTSPPLPLRLHFPYTMLKLILPESLISSSSGKGESENEAKNRTEIAFHFIAHGSITKSHVYVTLWNYVLSKIVEIVDAIRSRKVSEENEAYIARGLIFYIFTLYSLMLVTSNERIAKLRAEEDISNQQNDKEEVLMEDRLIDVLNYILEVENDSSGIRERLEALGREVQTILSTQDAFKDLRLVSSGKVDEAEDLIKTLLENISKNPNKVVRAFGSVVALIFTLNVKDWCEEANRYCSDGHGHTDECERYSYLCNLISSFCKPGENNKCRSLIDKPTARFLKEVNDIMAEMFDKIFNYISDIINESARVKVAELFFFPLLPFALARRGKERW